MKSRHNRPTSAWHHLSSPWRFEHGHMDTWTQIESFWWSTSAVIMFQVLNTRVASNAILRSSRSAMTRRWMNAEAKEAVKETTQKVAAPAESGGWWSSASFWGGLGAAAGWGMSISAIYDAAQQGPEVISLTMTPVLIVYSSLFARWAWVVQPRNLPLMYCHVANVAAQLNQFRRALEYKMEQGQEQQVYDMAQKIGMGGVVAAASVVAAPMVRSAMTPPKGVVSEFLVSDAGPLTVHFWAPMSKWFISGASFLELDRPTDKISLPQYSALTATGFFFSRYSLLVNPINYPLCAVNVALFVSSVWHLGRKVKADYIDEKKE